MAKVTVYVPDEQLAVLRQHLPGGPSRAFQAFLGQLQHGSGDTSYARALMPATAQVESLCEQAGARMQQHGGPAVAGPVRTALAILAYQALTAARPDLREQLEGEFSRLGLGLYVTAAIDHGPSAARPPGDGTGTGQSPQPPAPAPDQARVVVLGPDTELTDALTEPELAEFRRAHPGWRPGLPLTEPQLATALWVLRQPGSQHGDP